MKVYEARNLEKVIEKALIEFEKENIFLSIDKATKNCITNSSYISLKDIIENTDFFTKCITKEYQELIKKVYSYRWSLDISSISILDKKYYILIKVMQ